MSLKNYIKSSPTFSKLARRPLFYYSYLSKTIKSLQSASVSEREKATNQLLKKALFRALQTAYALNIGLPKSLDEWPICDKNTLQKNYHANLNRDVPDLFYFFFSFGCFAFVNLKLFI